MPAEPSAEYAITSHAAFEMARRGISNETVHGVMIAPAQRLPVRPGRVVLQSRIIRGVERKAALVRVFVDVDRTPAEVVTLYMTNKIAKYWDSSHEG